MITFKILVLWIHLLAVIIWLGGLFFYLLVVMPVLRKSPAAPAVWWELAEKILAGFDGYSKEVIGAIVLTGIFNLINTGWLIRFQFSTRYLQLLALKIGVFIIMIALHVGLRRALLPKLSHLNAIQSSELALLYRKYRITAALLLVMGAAAVVMGLTLRTM